jgi:hypothetical protein
MTDGNVCNNPMVTHVEHLELNYHVNYKQVKDMKKEWIISPIHHALNSDTTWCLQINNSHTNQLGVYVTLMNGAPCTVQSYKIFMLTNHSPPLMIFISQCTKQRYFPSNNYSWGFDHFCSRRELKDERDLIRNPKSKLIHLRCTLVIDISFTNNLNIDHRLSTDLFHSRSLEQWIELLKIRNDLPELNNRVNEQIEQRHLLANSM